MLSGTGCVISTAKSMPTGSEDRETPPTTIHASEVSTTEIDLIAKRSQIAVTVVSTA